MNQLYSCEEKMSKTKKTEKFHQWKLRLRQICHKQADFERWLFEQVSRVLFGRKSGELIKIQDKMMDLTLDQCTTFARVLCELWDVDLKVLHCKNDTCKLIVYNENLLNNRLSRASKKKLHKKLGYAIGIKAHEFLNELSHRWKSTDRIPHEVGLALGYPLKDVWGYMGLTKDSCSGCCGWQVFGDPRPSINLHRRYEEARREAKFLLHAA